MEDWWKRGIIYQIYPLSFQDSSSDGSGDLAGIRGRLDYFTWLGIDAIWLSPIYPSPMRDCGYDISDYCGIAPEFGTLQDFEVLVDDAHRRDIKVILDFVPNHTSDLHPWFQQSRSSRDNPRRNWYIWHDPAPGGGPPNNWVSNFGGSAWTLDSRTGQYYYHAFLAEQPDLNWRNPALRAAMYDVLRFWLDRGVDGFRVDVLWHLVKDANFRDDPPNPDYKPDDPHVRSLLHTYSADQPEIFEIIAEMRRVVNRYPSRILIGEIYLPVERLVAYYGVNGSGVHMPFNFQLILAPWNARRITSIVLEYERLVPLGEWPNWVIGNHDQPRIATRVGATQARIAAMLLLTLRGTPTLYYGDEIGMEDVPVPPHLVHDTWTKREPGIGIGRDPQRTPMQWDASPNAGFTRGVPWLPMSAARAEVNVQSLALDPRSILTLYRRLIALRRSHRALVSGSMRLVPPTADVMAYQRTEGSERLLIALNLGHEACELPPIDGMLLLSSHLDREGDLLSGPVPLRADEGIVVDISH